MSEKQTFLKISGGAQGTRQTLDFMRALVETGRTNPIIRQTAHNLIVNLPQKDFLGELRALHAFVRDTIRYTRDTNNIETISFAEETLNRGHGDCDDKSVLLASLLEAIGFKTRLAAVGFGRSGFHHVLVEVFHDGEWVPAETTEPVELGWHPRGVKRRMVAVTDSGKTLSGLDLKKIHAQLKKPHDQLMKALHIKTPDSLKKLGKKVKNNRVDILKGVIGAVALWYGGAAILGALRASGAAVASTADTAGTVDAGGVDGAIQTVKSGGFIERVVAEAAPRMTESTGIDFTQGDGLDWLKDAAKYEQSKTLADLEKVKRRLESGETVYSVAPESTDNTKFILPAALLVAGLVAGRVL